MNEVDDGRDACGGTASGLHFSGTRYSFKTVQHLFSGNRQGPSDLWRLLCKEYERPGIIFLTCSGVSVLLLGFDDFSPNLDEKPHISKYIIDYNCTRPPNLNYPKSKP